MNSNYSYKEPIARMNYLNKRRLFNIFLFSLFTCFILFRGTNTSLYAQNQIRNLSFVNSAQKSVSFPFKFINNLIILPVVINDSDTLQFILDTGVSTSIMTELSIGDNLFLNYTRQVKLNGLGQGEPIDALHSTGNNFNVSGIRGINQDLIILLQNVFDLSSVFGTRIHGLLGYNIFTNFIVEIDYSKKIISFHNPETYKYKKGWWFFQSGRKNETLPLIIHNTKPYILAYIVMNNGTRIPVKLLVDTGASHSLWLDTFSDTLIKVPDATTEVFLGKGLNGDIFGKLGKIPEAQIGNFVFLNPIVAFPDSMSAGQSKGLDYRNGTLGAELLRRFNVIIDYPNKKITLTKNNNFNDPFKVNRCGIDIEAPIPGLPYYLISHVRKGSPAEDSGLRRGDEIKYINNNHTYNLSINEIYEFFYRKPGRKIKLGIIRDEFNFSVDIYLSDFSTNKDIFK